MARGFLIKRKEKQLTKQLVFRTKTLGKRVIKVSHHAEFQSTDTLCVTCNRMSEIRKEPRRCPKHAGGLYA